MDRQAKANEIIQEYRESSQQIRSIISEYEATEYRLFKIMLEKLGSLNSEDSRQTCFGREFETTLD